MQLQTSSITELLPWYKTDIGVVISNMQLYDTLKITAPGVSAVPLYCSGLRPRSDSVLHLPQSDWLRHLREFEPSFDELNPDKRGRVRHVPRRLFYVRPAVIVSIDGVEYLADIVAVFALPLHPPRGNHAAPGDISYTRPYAFVQWHKDIELNFALPCRCTVLDNTYSIIPCYTILRTVVVIPALSKLPPSAFPPVTVNVPVLHAASGTVMLRETTRVFAFSNLPILSVG